MGGNVSEWCLDWHSMNYYSISPEYNPTGPTGGTYRITRGGAWRHIYDPEPNDSYPRHEAKWYIRCARRGPVTPATSNNTLGFRICYAQ